MEAGTGQEDKVLCYPCIPHNCHNSHHTSVLALEEGAHSLAGCLRRRVVEVALQELAGKPLEVLVLEALGVVQQQREEYSLHQAPVLELVIGHGKVVPHSLEHEEHHLIPAVGPENLMS